MSPRLLRYLALSADRSAVWRAGVLSAVLALVLVAIKFLRLPSGGSTGLFQGNLFAEAGQLLRDVLEPAMAPKLLLSTALLTLLVYIVAKRKAWRYSFSAAALLAPLLVYAGSVAAGVVSHDPQPFFSLMFQQTPGELRGLLAMFWPDLLVVVGLFTLLTACYSAPGRWQRSARLGAALLIGVVFAVLGLDFAYYIATRTDLTPDELWYALRWPRDALIAAKDGASLDSLWAIVFVAGLLLAGLWMARRLGAPSATAMRVRTGFFIWPALTLILLAPESPKAHAWQPFADNAVTRFGSDIITRPLMRLATTGRHIDPSKRVPVLEKTPVSALKTAHTRPLNVVVIMMESVRADATSVYASHRDTTPFLAELAKESLVVDQMYAVVPRTSAAWIATLAGRFPAPASVLRRWSDSREAPQLDSSLARLLRAHGYVSAWFTPTRVDFENEQQILAALGFDEIVSEADLNLDEKTRINEFGHEDRVILGPLGRWLDQRRREQKPFFLTLMTNVAHFPYELPADVPMRAFHTNSPAESAYLRSVQFLDGVLRDIVGQLRERDLLEQTVLVVLGDHGEAFLEHGGFTHFRVIYEESLRIPMLIRLPVKFDKQGHVAGLRQQIDVVPTVVDALGLELKGGPLPGRSLLGSDPGHSALFFGIHFDKINLAMRAGNMKYIYYFGHRPMEAYDLALDPGERTNLYPTLPAEAREQAVTDLLEWRRRVGASFDTRPPR